MEALVQIVTHTPVYVFPALAYGVFAGIRGLRPRSVSIQTMPILPAVFLVLAITSLVTAASVLPTAVFAWVVALAAGIALGASLMAARVLQVDRDRSRVTVGGSATALVLFLAIFALKYMNGVVHARNAGLAAAPAFILAVTVLSGVSTGIMVGRVAKLFSVYFRARAAVA